MLITRFTAGTTLLFAALIALITVMVHGSAYQCIRYTGFGLLDGALLDAATGHRFGAARPAVIPGTATLYERSPDGNWIAYTEPRANSTLVDLKLIKTLGLGRHVLYTVDGNEVFLNFRWSPDSNKLILFEGFTLQNRHRLVLLPFDAAPQYSPMQSGEAPLLRYLEFSPDGRYLVQVQDDSSATRLRINILDAQTLTPVMTSIQRLSGNLYFYQPYALSPNSSYFAYLTVVDGGAALNIADLRRTSEQSFPLKSPVGMPMEILWSPDSHHIAVVTSADGGATSLRSVQLIAVDGTSALEITASALLAAYADGMYLPYTVEWSADGAALYYLENHEERLVADFVALDLSSGARRVVASRLRYRPTILLDGTWVCVVRSPGDTAELHSLSTSSVPVIPLAGLNTCVTPMVSPDNETLVALGYGSDVGWVWVRRTGETGSLGVNVQPLGWSPDGKWLIYGDTAANDAGATGLRIFRVDVETWTSQLVVDGVLPPISISPDGSLLAAQQFTPNLTLILASLDGSGVHQRQLGAMNTTYTLSDQIRWSPDSSKLFYGYPTASSSANGMIETTVEIVDREGSLIRRFVQPPNIGDWGAIVQTAHWSQCDSTM